MTTKEMIAVIEAINDEKLIQFRHKGCPEGAGWTIIKGLKTPNFADFDYRVMPEPTYEPYTAETFAEAIEKHGYIIKYKGREDYALIMGWNDNGFYLPYEMGTNSFRNLLEKWVWRDDLSPCGILTDSNE